MPEGCFLICWNPEDLPIMNLEHEFPARYWINLGRRQDRRVETEWQLQKAGITAERLSAVDANFVRNAHGYESAGRYALALTQRLAIRKAMLAGAKAVLVMEDDVVFHPEIIERLREIDLPEDWGIFYPGCAHHQRPVPAGDGLVRTPYALDTHAFAVRAPYFRQVMAALRVRTEQDVEHARASDWFLANLHKQIPTYACYPNLAWQAISDSDLAGGVYSNYTPSGEQKAGAGEIVGLQAEMWGGRRWNSSNAIPSHADDDICHPSNREPRLGLLFLTRDDVNQPEIWQQFTEDAGSGVRVFSHSMQPVLAEAGFLAGTSINDFQETRWGDISLVRAMMALLKAALEDPSLTHFAFVSESCIPIRPWKEMARRLRIDPRSLLDYRTGSEMKPHHLSRLSTVRDLPDRCRRMHAQWCVLARDAAECVAEFDFTEHFEGFLAPDEHYIGSVLALRGFDEAGRIHRAKSTWTKWTEQEGLGRPKTVLEVDAALAGELASFPGLFARKFAAESDVGRWGLHQTGPKRRECYETPKSADR